MEKEKKCDLLQDLTDVEMQKIFGGENDKEQSTYEYIWINGELIVIRTH